jgi:hypothetical protein
MVLCKCSASRVVAKWTYVKDIPSARDRVIKRGAQQ